MHQISSPVRKLRDDIMIEQYPVMDNSDWRYDIPKHASRHDFSLCVACGKHWQLMISPADVWHLMLWEFCVSHELWLMLKNNWNTSFFASIVSLRIQLAPIKDFNSPCIKVRGKIGQFFCPMISHNYEAVCGVGGEKRFSIAMSLYGNSHNHPLIIITWTVLAPMRRMNCELVDGVLYTLLLHFMWGRWECGWLCCVGGLYSRAIISAIQPVMNRLAAP